MSSIARTIALGSGVIACCLTQVWGQMTMPPGHPMPPEAAMPAPEKLPAPQKMAGLGNLHFAISSKNPETQAWMDQGINLVFDFWDYEANRAFEQAIRIDADCAICHWALAESLGIHNSEMQGYAHDELMKAVALRSHADKREKMYIDAAQAESGSITGKYTSAGGNDKQATQILRQIVHKYPQDLTAKLLLSEALQDGYDHDTGKARPGTAEMITILQGILKEQPDNSAANHLWIHAVEASPHPEQALQSAKILASLAPNSGHMTHMPGHIFYRIGDYQQAQVAFDHSESVDEAYMRNQNVAVDDDWNYVHNLMYSIANLLEEGRMTDAAVTSKKLTSARGVRAATLYPWSTRDAMTRLNPLLPLWLRTANWAAMDESLAKVETPAQFPNLHVLAASLTAYARGMKAIDAKDIESARKESAELDAQLWRASQEPMNNEDKKPEAAARPAAMPMNTVQPTDPNLEMMLKNLAILSLELRSAILVSNDKIPEAETLLAQARKDEVDLGYREPPAFIQPVDEFEAGLLMRAGKTGEAEKAWKQALLDRPNSGFPLYGLAEMAARSGNLEQARTAYAEFLAAWKNADLNLPQVEAAREWMQGHPATALASDAQGGADEGQR